MFRTKNDGLIEELIKDPNYRFSPDGTILTRIAKTGKITNPTVWRVAGCRCHHKQKDYWRIRYKGKQLPAHRIVYRFFNGHLKPNLQINHKDGNGLNNNPENLELVTPASNNLHAYRVTGKKPVIGYRRVSDRNIKAIRKAWAEGKSQNKLAKKYGLAKSTVSYIVNRKTWKSA